jgi:hypothetical protein
LHIISNFTRGNQKPEIENEENVPNPDFVFGIFFCRRGGPEESLPIFVFRG